MANAQGMAHFEDHNKLARKVRLQITKQEEKQGTLEGTQPSKPHITSSKYTLLIELKIK